MHSVLGSINRLRALGLAAVLAVSMSGTALAACSPGAASPQKISNFLANPSSLLNGGSRSSSEVSSDVRDLVASDPSTLAAVIGLLKGTPPPSSDMQKAIGTGLGLAAGICIRPDPTFAAEIQAQLAGTDSTDAKQQYAAVTGNQLIGAAGGGGGGGAVSGGASGGQVNPLPNISGGTSGLQGFAANSVSNNPTSYFSGGTSGISAVTQTTTTTSVSASTP